MARREARSPAQREVRLTPLRERCVSCDQRLWVAYHARRTLMTFRGLVQLTLVVRRCRNAECELYHLPYRAEEEGAWALPHGEFGLDVITVIGQLRYGEHRSIPEIHQRLESRGVGIAQRTVTDLLERYEELVALHLADEERLQQRLRRQGQVILAIDGMQPDVGHEVLWVIRDCLSGEVLLARSLLSSTQGDLSALLGEVKEALSVPIKGVISDGQKTIRQAVAKQFPGIPHQLCQFHYLREAANPIFEADRHAKTELKKLVRGVRPIERSLDGQEDEQAEAMQGYCLAGLKPRSPMMVAPRYVPPASNCTIDSPRSPTPAHASRKKGGTSLLIERVATAANACLEEDRGVVACTGEGVRPRSPGGTSTGQS